MTGKGRGRWLPGGTWSQWFVGGKRGDGLLRGGGWGDRRGPEPVVAGWDAWWVGGWRTARGGGWRTGRGVGGS